MMRRTVRAVVAAGAFLLGTAAPACVAAQVDFAITGVTASEGAVDAGASATFGARVSLSAGAPEALTPLAEFFLYSDAAMTTVVTPLCRANLTVAPGGEAAVACSQSIPSSLPSGTYFVGAQVNGDGRYPETSDANNSAAGPAIQVSYRSPDFSIASVTASATALDVGGSAAFGATISSAAGASEAATPFTVIGLYSDAALTARVATLCADTVWVAPGGSGTLTCTATVPATLAPGTYYVGAQVNADARYLETNDANDMASGPAMEIVSRPPDFTIADVAVSTTRADAGGAATFSAMVSCGADASGTFAPEAEFLLYSDAALTSVVTSLCHAVVTVVPGASATVTCTQTIPSSLRSGMYFVGAAVNRDGRLVETDGSNNSAPGPAIEVTYRNPDFAIARVTASGLAVEPGGTATFSALLSSAAGASEAATPLVVISLFSDEAMTAALATLCSDSVWVAPGGTGALSCASVVPAVLPPGEYVVGAQVNGDHRYAETNESNNGARGPTLIVGPDLLLSSFSAPTLAAADSWVEIADTVTNQGAAAGSFVVSYYLSPDAEIATADLLLGTRTVSGLGAGNSSAATTRLQVPAGVSGRMYLGAIVDSGLAVVEANESNNSSTASPIELFVDGAPPAIAISGVGDGEFTSAVPLSVCYSAADDHLAADEGRLDDIPFRGCAVATSEGAHSLTVTATDLAGHVATSAVSFTIDTTRPSVTIVSPLPGTSRSRDVEVTALALDAGGVLEVMANGVQLAPRADGAYRGFVSLADGPNTVVVTAVDRAGNSAPATVDVRVVPADTTPLALSLSAPASGFIATSSAVYVEGQVTGGVAPVAVFVAGTAVSTALDGRFATIAPASMGPVTVPVEARDAVGNTALQLVSGTRTDTPAGTNVTAREVAPRGSMRYLYDAAGNLTAAVDTARDVNNCGQLATQCPLITGAGGETACVGGACGALAGGVFLDVWTDPLHCGTSMAECPRPAQGSATCSAGVCGISCSSGYVPVGAECVDLLSDSRHCGRVGNACSDSTVCQDGQCRRSGSPTVYGVNGVAAPGVAFRDSAWTGLRVEGEDLDTVVMVALEDWGPDSVGTEIAAPQFVAWVGGRGNGNYVGFLGSATSILIPYQEPVTRDLLRRWTKVRLMFMQGGILRELLVDVAVSLDDQVPANRPAPSITGVSVLETRALAWHYDPVTGFLLLVHPQGRCGLDPTIRPPRAVLGQGGPGYGIAPEFPVRAVTHEGVYLDAGLRGVDLGLGDEARLTSKVTLVFGDTGDPSEFVDLGPLAYPSPLNCVPFHTEPQVGGLIIRGSNLLADGSVAVVGLDGNRITTEVGRPEFLDDRIVIRPSELLPYQGGANRYATIKGIQTGSAIIEVTSPRGTASTPWPVGWLDSPAIDSIGPQPFVAYDQVMTLTGRFFSHLRDVAFSGAGLVEHLTETTTSPPGPGQYHVVDEHHIELMLSSTGVVPRKLSARCISCTPTREEFPGSRSFTVTNVVGAVTAATNAVDPSHPELSPPPPLPVCPPCPEAGGGGSSSSSSGTSTSNGPGMPGYIGGPSGGNAGPNCGSNGSSFCP